MNQSCFFVPVATTLILLVAAQPIQAAGYTGTVLYSMTISGGSNEVPLGAVAGQVVVSSASGVGGQALLWTASGSMVNLNPSGFSSPQVWATNGSAQVGQAESSADNNNLHALLWSSSAASVVDLNPTTLSGITNSQAIGISGSQQVGGGFGSVDGGEEHALLWSETATSVVDLNPTTLANLFGSVAIGTDGTHQAGYAFFGSFSGFRHAILWSGTAASAVDLNPSGITDSQASGVGGGQEVGVGSGSETGGLGSDHAVLWSGTATSAIDLNPTNLSGYTRSFAAATNGISQVGGGSVNSGKTQALLWSGTPNSAVNLQSILPAGTWADSTAWSIDASGNIFGTADGTFNGVTSTFAVEWSPVPEPGTALLLALCVIGILVRPIRRNCSALAHG